MSKIFRLLAFLGSVLPILAVEPLAAKKLAFIVGIGAYEHLPTLTSPEVDAAKMGLTLGKLGFETTIAAGQNAERTKLVILWSRFLAAIKPGDQVVVYYSGHGVEIEGQNYLLPKDTPTVDELAGSDALKKLLLSLPDLIAELSKKPAAVSIWILDACRDNPFHDKISGKGIGGTAGLNASAVGPPESFIFYAAGFGETALDGSKDGAGHIGNSLYTRILTGAIEANPHTPANMLAVAIKTQVRQAASPHLQRPAYYDGLDEPWCFRNCAASTQHQAVIATAFKNLVVADLKTVNAEIKEISPEHTEEPNAVFLGKKSAVASCATGPSDRHPFGCQLLEDVVAGGAAKHLNVSVLSSTEVFLREKIPIVSGDSANYACKVGVLKAGEPITLTSITSLHYLDDNFYWGSVAGPSRKCRAGAGTTTTVIAPNGVAIGGDNNNSPIHLQNK